MYMYSGKFCVNCVNRQPKQEKSTPPPVCCGHSAIYLFTYLFSWFIPMNCAS